jgi:NUC153 domain
MQAKKVRPGDVLTDSRFAAMFENRDFEVDLDADEYKQLHPNAGEQLVKVLECDTSFAPAAGLTLQASSRAVCNQSANFQSKGANVSPASGDP